MLILALCTDKKQYVVQQLKFAIKSRYSYFWNVSLDICQFKSCISTTTNVSDPILHLGASMMGERLYCNTMSVKCPPNLQLYLPLKTLNITAFIAFTFPPTSPLGAPWLIRPEKFYAKLPLTTNNITQATNFATPPERIVDALWKLVCTQASTAGRWTVLSTLSCFLLERDCGSVQNLRKWWQVVTNLHQELLNNLTSSYFQQADTILPIFHGLDILLDLPTQLRSISFRPTWQRNGLQMITNLWCWTFLRKTLQLPIAPVISSLKTQPLYCYLRQYTTTSKSMITDMLTSELKLKMMILQVARSNNNQSGQWVLDDIASWLYDWGHFLWWFLWKFNVYRSAISFRVVDPISHRAEIHLLYSEDCS